MMDRVALVQLRVAVEAKIAGKSAPWSRFATPE